MDVPLVAFLGVIYGTGVGESGRGGHAGVVARRRWKVCMPSACQGQSSSHGSQPQAWGSRYSRIGTHAPEREATPVPAGAAPGGGGGGASIHLTSGKSRSDVCTFAAAGGTTGMLSANHGPVSHFAITLSGAKQTNCRGDVPGFEA